MSKRRVVVTGLGAITPVGNTAVESWGNLLAGNSGISNITHFDVAAYATQFAGTITDFDLMDVISVKDTKKWIYSFNTVLSRVMRQ